MADVPANAPAKQTGNPAAPRPLAARFRTSPMTLFIDAFMTIFIKVGGLTIIVAVLGIFVFILWNVIPLFAGAHIAPKLVPASAASSPEKGDQEEGANLPDGTIAAIGIDEWSALPFAAYLDGRILFTDPTTGAVTATEHLGGEGDHLSTLHYNTRDQTLVGATDDGRMFAAKVAWQSNLVAGKPVVTETVTAQPAVPIANGKILAIDYADAGDSKLAAAISDDHGKRVVSAVTLVQGGGGGLGDDNSGAITVGDRIDLTKDVPGTPASILVDARAESILVATSEGTIHYFFKTDSGFEHRQSFTPFDDADHHGIASLDYLFGDVSLVLTNADGKNRIFSLYIHPGEKTSLRTWGRTKDLPTLEHGAETYAMSTRNKSFLLTTGATASLRYGTSASVRWENKLPFTATATAINAKSDAIAMLDDHNHLHLMAMSDKHPEAGLHALFGKVWYEGQPAPEFAWQSSGGSDDFEPKLSLMPLIFGTLKGTFYAMLFAIPIAILGALYTAEFLHPTFKAYIKPTIEVMASLPSVVLGFLAAQWLAPMIFPRVPSVLMCLVLVPSVAMLFGWGWSRLPIHYRALIKPGQEFLYFVPVMLITGMAAWYFGIWFEAVAFTVPAPTAAEPTRRIADFARWWADVTGMGFDQRSSLVVGIMMGFAVIPIIFTISEDALANVPKNLRSASLALGASRWQTAWKVVLPTASAGIFSALMIGLGRAIGETMIMVMATGNTPIIDWDPFNGMRTLSANIATELPEAAVGGTLFRTLFLCALLLFILTFIINTIAELMRQHLREKYKTV